jgi:hypothetical protein
MFHPLSEDLNQYSIAQLEAKLSDLRKKYFQSRNAELRQQIGVFVEVYNQELKQRLAAEQVKMAKETGKDLDNLINID